MYYIVNTTEAQLKHIAPIINGNLIETKEAYVL